MPVRVWNGEGWEMQETPEEQAARERRDDERDSRLQPPAPPAPTNVYTKPLGTPPPSDLPGPHGDPTQPQPLDLPPVTTPAPTGDFGTDWKSHGYIDPDGKVTLPWGERVTLTEAMNMYYKDRKPTANEIPPWAQVKWQNATGTPVRYFNQIPKDLRGVFQQLLDAAYTGQQTKPDISYMTGQAAYR